jgi:predicted alpha/beta-fold hydrolase
MNYAAPLWLPGGQLQTIWPALWARRMPEGGAPPSYRRERWETPDGDFVDVDHVQPAAEVLGPAQGAEVAGAAFTGSVSAAGAGTAAREVVLPSTAAPLLVVFHGLEGSSRSHYGEALAAWAQAQGWACALPHFRGCSGEINRAPRAYHSGDTAEIGWMLQRLRAQHAGPLLAVGVSLGGNALLRWAGELQEDAARSVDAIAAVCAPVDLAAGARAIGRGLNRQIYTRMFMRTLVPKALRKLEQFPGLFDRQQLLAARDLYGFDNVFTAPVHGYRDADDYWARASAKPLLAGIRVPTLVLNARNDPFVPENSLPQPGTVGPCVQLWQPAQGGHVGFAAGAWPSHVQAMPEAVGRWLQAQLA